MTVQGRAELRTVTLGQRTDCEAVALTGLTAGETVIIHPGDTITAGSRVERR